jgi:hypothetical protein
MHLGKIIDRLSPSKQPSNRAIELAWILAKARGSRNFNKCLVVATQIVADVERARSARNRRQRVLNR